MSTEDMRPHYVYRCYDADGRLLYVGCTVNVSRRMSSHRGGTARASQWLRACMTRYEVSGPYEGLAAAREAERLAIVAERPVFNYQEQRPVAWMTRASVASYLVDRGLRDLAIATACTCWTETREANQTDSWCMAHADEAVSA